jgi:hypothetical protein
MSLMRHRGEPVVLCTVDLVLVSYVTWRRTWRHGGEPFEAWRKRGKLVEIHETRR